jgi:hypothetical protein
VSSIVLRRDFLFSLGPAVLRGNSSVVVCAAVSPRPIGGHVPIPLALGIVLGKGFALAAPYGLTAEEACVRAEGSLFGEVVPIGAGAGEAFSPGLAVAPAVPVTSVPAAATVRGPRLTP